MNKSQINLNDNGTVWVVGYDFLSHRKVLVFRDKRLAENYFDENKHGIGLENVTQIFLFPLSVDTANSDDDITVMARNYFMAECESHGLILNPDVSQHPYAPNDWLDIATNIF